MRMSGVCTCACAYLTSVNQALVSATLTLLILNCIGFVIVFACVCDWNLYLPLFVVMFYP